MRPSFRLLAAVLLVAAPVVGRAQAGGRARPDSVAPKTVAVLYFDNATGNADYDPMGRGMAAMLITDLSGVPEIRLVERDRMQAVLDEQRLQSSNFFDPATAVKTGKLLGAEYLLTGSMTASRPDMRIDTRVIRVETGEIVRSAKVQGKEEQFFDLQQKLARELIKGLPIAVSPEATEALRQRQQRNRIDDASTMVTFSQGLRSFDNRDYVDAVEKFGRVMLKSPETTVFQLSYAEARRRSGNAAKEKVRSGLRDMIRKRIP